MNPERYLAAPQLAQLRAAAKAVRAHDEAVDRGELPRLTGWAGAREVAEIVMLEVQYIESTR